MEWESSYDPEVHGDPWHNNNPFVLEEYRKRVKKCRGCATPFVDRRRKHPAPNFVVSHRERVIFWTKKQTTTRLRAKSLLPVQSLVYKADSPLLQLSRIDGGTHRRSKVDRRRRPGGWVRRRGPIVCADERLLERCCCWYSNLRITRATRHYRTILFVLIISYST